MERREVWKREGTTSRNYGRGPGSFIFWRWRIHQKRKSFEEVWVSKLVVNIRLLRGYIKDFGLWITCILVYKDLKWRKHKYDFVKYVVCMFWFEYQRLFTPIKGGKRKKRLTVTVGTTIPLIVAILSRFFKWKVYMNIWIGKKSMVV